MDLQYTAGKNIPLTDYLSRNPVHGNNDIPKNEDDSEEEYVINQIINLFNFTAENGSIEKFKRNNERSINSQSQTTKIIGQQMIDNRTNLNPPAARTTSKDKHRNLTTYEQIVPVKSVIHPNSSINIISCKDTVDKMERKVNGIDIDFIIKQRGHSPETKKSTRGKIENTTTRTNKNSWERKIQ